MSSVITVVYKSGAKVHLHCSEFTTKYNRTDNELTGVEWADAKPKPLYFGLKEVAAIYDGKV